MDSGLAPPKSALPTWAAISADLGQARDRVARPGMTVFQTSPRKRDPYAVPSRGRTTSDVFHTTVVMGRRFRGDDSGDSAAKLPPQHAAGPLAYLRHDP